MPFPEENGVGSFKKVLVDSDKKNYLKNTLPLLPFCSGKYQSIICMSTGIHRSLVFITNV